MTDRTNPMTTADAKLELVARLRKHSYRLPEGFYSDTDYGCNEDCPESLIMAVLDHGPQGTEVMQELTACGFTIVETEALNQAITALEASPHSRTEAITDEMIEQHTAFAVTMLRALMVGIECNNGVRGWSRAASEQAEKVFVEALNDNARSLMQAARLIDRQGEGVPASPSGCQPSASAAEEASSRSGIPNAKPKGE